MTANKYIQMKIIQINYGGLQSTSCTERLCYTFQPHQIYQLFVKTFLFNFYFFVNKGIRQMTVDGCSDNVFRKIVTDFVSRTSKGNLFHKRVAATPNDEWP